VSEATDTKYSIEIGVAATLRVLERDKSGELFHCFTVGLFAAIDNVMGVYDCNYDGHFGPYIYFTVEKDYDTPETHAKVHSLIREYVK
jgi:hypothetical protein